LRDSVLAAQDITGDIDQPSRIDVMDQTPDHPRLPTSAVVLVVLGVVVGALGIVLLVFVGALGLLLTGPSIALLATGFAIARKHIPDA
jgi:hypothetical protein